MGVNPLFNKTRNCILVFEVNDYRRSNLGVRQWDKRMVLNYIRSNLDPILRFDTIAEDVLCIAFSWILDYQHYDPREADQNLDDALQSLIDDHYSDDPNVQSVSDQAFQNAKLTLVDISNFLENSFLRAYERINLRWRDYEIMNVIVSGAAFSVEFIERDIEPE